MNAHQPNFELGQIWLWSGLFVFLYFSLDGKESCFGKRNILLKPRVTLQARRCLLTCERKPQPMPGLPYITYSPTGPHMLQFSQWKVALPVSPTVSPVWRSDHPFLALCPAAPGIFCIGYSLIRWFSCWPASPSLPWLWPERSHHTFIVIAMGEAGVLMKIECDGMSYFSGNTLNGSSSFWQRERKKENLTFRKNI